MTVNLDEMWVDLARLQPLADGGGFGDAWRRMVAERTVEAASAAAVAASAAAAFAAANAAFAAVAADFAAAFAAARDDAAAEDRAKYRAGRVKQWVEEALKEAGA